MCLIFVGGWKMKVHALFACALAASVAAGCSEREASRSVAKENWLTKPAAILATRAFAGPCVLDAHKEAAILPLILPSLISAGLSGLGAAIREASQEKTVTVTATTNLVVEDRLPDCIQIVRGLWYADHRHFASDANPLGLSVDGERQTANANLRSVGAWLAEPPDFFFEGRILPRTQSDTHGPVTLAASILILNRSLDSSIAATFGGRRDVVVSVSLKPAGDGQSAVGGSLTAFQDITPGTRVAFSDDPPPANATEPRRHWETGWIDVPAKGQHVLEMTFSETRNASQFLAFVADVFDGAKGNIETLIKQATLRTERIKAKRAEEEERQRQREDRQAKFAAAMDSYVAARSDLANCKSAAKDLKDIQRLGLLASYLKSRSAAEVAILAAGSPPEAPLTDLTQIQGCPP